MKSLRVLAAALGISAMMGVGLGYAQQVIPRGPNFDFSVFIVGQGGEGVFCAMDPFEGNVDARSLKEFVMAAVVEAMMRNNEPNGGCTYHVQVHPNFNDTLTALPARP